MTLIGYLLNTAFQVFEDIFLPRILTLWFKIEPHYQTWKRVAIGLVVGFNICCFSLSISAFLFGTIYFYNMPTVFNTFPLNFHYNRNCIQYHKAFERDCDHRGERIYNEKCFPVAATLLSSPKHPKLLQEAQLYTVIAKITLPETPRNLDIGMFMIHMKVEGRSLIDRPTKQPKIRKYMDKVNSYFTEEDEELDKEYSITYKSSKATSIKYVSLAIRMITTALFWPFFIADFWQEAQTVNEIIFNELLLEKKNYNWTGIVYLDHPGIDLYHAEIDVVAKFTGIQYYLYRWPIISFLLGTSLFFLPVLMTVLIFLYFCIWGPFIAKSTHPGSRSLDDNGRQGSNRRRRASLEGNDEDPVETIPTNSTPASDLPSSSRRSSCSSSSIEMLPSRPSVSQMSYVLTTSMDQMTPDDLQQEILDDKNKEHCEPSIENEMTNNDDSGNSATEMRRRVMS